MKIQQEFLFFDKSYFKDRDLARISAYFSGQGQKNYIVVKDEKLEYKEIFVMILKSAIETTQMLEIS